MRAEIETDTGTITVHDGRHLLAILEKSLEGKQPKCPEGCHDCCCAVQLTSVEAERIGKPGSRRTEWDKNDNCEFLKDGRCACYDQRPLTCRAYGCAPAGLLHCGKLKPEDAPLTLEHAEAIFEGHFWIMVDEGNEPDMELLESCARHDTRTGLRKGDDDLKALREAMKNI